MKKTLDQRARNVLAEASLLAEASAQNLEAPKTSHGKAGSAELRSQGKSTFDLVAGKLSDARGDTELAFAVAWCENEVKRVKCARARELTPDQQHYWIIVAAQGREYRDVAEEHGMKEKTVWKMRSDAGMDPRYGFPKGHKRAA